MNLLPRPLAFLCFFTQIGLLLQAETSPQAEGKRSDDSCDIRVAHGGEHRLQLLPPGSIAVEGLLLKHMQEDARQGWVAITQEQSLQGRWMDGWGSFRLRQTDRKQPYYKPFIDKTGAPVGGEYQAHWLDAVFRFAWTGNMSDYQQLAQEAMEAIFDNEGPTGFIGVDTAENQLQGKTQDGRYGFYAWGEMLRALLQYYAYTEDERALELARSSVDQYFQLFDDPSKLVKKWSVVVVSPLAELGMITGEERYTQAAEGIFAAWQRSPHAKGNWGELLSSPNHIAGHAAGWGIYLLAASDLYAATGKEAYLDAVINASKIITEEHRLPHGSVSHDEKETVCGSGPNEKAELCSHWWYAWLWSALTRFTGDAHYADLAETILYNATPASRAQDARAVRYYMCSNQLVTPKGKRPFPKGLYQERQYIECCMSNAPRIVPLMVDRMIMRRGAGLAFLYYAPYKAEVAVDDGQILHIHCETEYPFDSTLTFTLNLSTPVAMPLSFRVPEWSDDHFQITVNGAECAVSYDAESQWLTIDRTWQDSDQIQLTLPMQVRVTTDPEQGAYITRGPLLFSLAVPGVKSEWTKHGYYAYKEQLDESAAWNYALALRQDDNSAGIRVERSEPSSGGYAWQDAPVQIVVPAARIDDWTFRPDDPGEWHGLPLEAPALPVSPVAQEDPLEDIRLVPIGYTSLRMSYFPFFYR